MVKLIQQFVSCCRAAGMRVSTSEVLDSLNQMKLIDPTDEQQFRSLLRSNFAKSMRDVQHFDRLYHLFFHEMRMDDCRYKTGSFLFRSDKKSCRTSQADCLMTILFSMPWWTFCREILWHCSGKCAGFKQRKKRLCLRFNLGPLGNRLNVMLQINKAASAAQALVEDNYAKTDSVAGRELAAYFEERVAAARSILAYEPRPGDTGTRKTKTDEQKLKGLGEKSFSSFTREEIEEMRDAIDKLVRKLKNIVSRRYAVRNRGSIDVKKTLRASAKYNGVPVEIKYRHRAKRKSRIVTLCDVSGSVWAAARFMLNLLYCLQDCFDKVNSFVFIDQLSEVTSIFEENEINEAIRLVLEKSRR